MTATQIAAQSSTEQLRLFTAGIENASVFVLYLWPGELFDDTMKNFCSSVKRRCCGPTDTPR